MLRRNARLRREYLYRKGLEGKERAEYERKRLIREALAGEWCGVVVVWRRLSFSSCAAAAASRPPFPPPHSLHPEGKPLPTELRRDAAALKRQVELEDDNTAVPRTHVDDEYARAAEREPKVCRGGWRERERDGDRRRKTPPLRRSPQHTLTSPLTTHHTPHTTQQILVTTSRDPSSRLTQFAKEVRLVLPGSTRLNRGGTVVADLIASARSHDFTDVIVLHEHRGQPDGLVVCHLPFGPTAYFGVYNAVR
jgi:U3 small nucleolar ribonucleoprotein protein IMP4